MARVLAWRRARFAAWCCRSEACSVAVLWTFGAIAAAGAAAHDPDDAARPQPDRRRHGLRRPRARALRRRRGGARATRAGGRCAASSTCVLPVLVSGATTIGFGSLLHHGRAGGLRVRRLLRARRGGLDPALAHAGAGGAGAAAAPAPGCRDAAGARRRPRVTDRLEGVVDARARAHLACFSQRHASGAIVVLGRALRCGRGR